MDDFRKATDRRRSGVWAAMEGLLQKGGVVATEEEARIAREIDEMAEGDPVNMARRQKIEAIVEQLGMEGTAETKARREIEAALREVDGPGTESLTYNDEGSYCDDIARGR